MNEGILSYENRKESRIFNAEFKPPIVRLFLLVAHSSETTHPVVKERNTVGPLKIKVLICMGCTRNTMPVPWCTYLSNAQSWNLRMYVPISDDFGVFVRMHISQPQISM